MSRQDAINLSKSQLVFLLIIQVVEIFHRFHYLDLCWRASPFGVLGLASSKGEVFFMTAIILQSAKVSRGEKSA
jgi:hypothetical protein